MNTSKPAGCHLNCWGVKYQDGDRECEQCKWNDTCRSRMFEVAASMPLRAPTLSLPVYQPRPTPTLVSPGLTVGNVPMPTHRTPSVPATYAPAATTVPVVQPRYAPATPTTPPPPPQAGYPQQYPQYHQTYQGYSIPNPHKPNPMEPMFRPGAQGPAYYFNQYPEESVASRLTKNMMLRGLEAVFGELMNFFRHWTWPPMR